MISTRIKPRIITTLCWTRKLTATSAHIPQGFVSRAEVRSLSVSQIYVLSSARLLSSSTYSSKNMYHPSDHDQDALEKLQQNGSRSSNFEAQSPAAGMESNTGTTDNYANSAINHAKTVPRDGRELFRELLGVDNATIRESGLGGFRVTTSSASPSLPTMAGAEATTRLMSAASTATAAAGSMSSVGNSPTLTGRRLRNRLAITQQRGTGGSPAATTGMSSNNTVNGREEHSAQQQPPYFAGTSSTCPESVTRQLQSVEHCHVPDIAARVPVTSIYAARHIDVVGVLSKVFGKMNLLQHRFGRTSVTVQFPPVSLKTPSDDGKGNEQDLTSSTPCAVEETLLPRYIVVFSFGSVVFFNFTNREARAILEEIKGRSDCSVDPIPNGFEQRERFDIAISPGLEEPEAIVTGDVATIKMLDLNSVAVISTIMGQTVALDSYNVIVDELLATFATINANVKRTGNFTSMERDALFKVIAQNNSLFIDMVSKLRLKDRSDTAWNFTQYDAVYQGMREEFLIDNRFDDIEFKLNLIQQNTKFFLEVMHQNKTNFLEWVIIGLITLECGLMCLEMSGMGHLLFESLGITDVAPPESFTSTTRLKNT